jgi:predicted NBD/HSP70 family sugar kinase
MTAQRHSASPLGRLFREISKRGESSSGALARALGLKPSTLASKLRELHAKGLIVFQNGRRRVALNPHFGYVVGIDMGASHLHYALADFRGEILSDATQKIRPEDGPQKLIAQIKEGIRRLADGQAERGRIQGLAIGVPSPVHPLTGLVSFANNLPGWRDIDLGSQLAQAFRIPVRIENDANAAALGEHWRGVARGTDCFVFIALGTGIGSGIFIHGRLHTGSTGSAGELFRLHVEWPRWQEDFGVTGYFESYASGLGIAAAGRELKTTLGAPISPGLAEERDARFVFESFQRGDPQARAVLEKIFIILGVGIANLVSILDPALIVVGGGVAKGAPEFMLTTVENVVKTIHPDPPPIRLSALEDKAQTFGAIFSALEAATEAIARRLG